MKNIIKYIILLLSISFAQESVLSSLNNTEAMLYYQSERLSPIQAVIYQATFPTLGYAYANNWEKGINLELFRMMSLAVAIYGLSWSDKKNDWNNQPFGYLGLFSLVGVSVYQFIDVYKVAKSYNSKLYHSLFGTNPPEFSLNLQPTYQGANLTMSYAFD